MKANELRIGNWIHNENGYDVKVTSILDDDTIKAETISFQELSWYEPIPLTEEWLERFGFELDIRYNGIYVKQYEEQFGIQVFEDGDIWHVEGIFTSDNGEEQGLNIVYMEYVHQLQNLYFALTGEELTVKEHA